MREAEAAVDPVASESKTSPPPELLQIRVAKRKKSGGEQGDRWQMWQLNDGLV